MDDGNLKSSFEIRGLKVQMQETPDEDSATSYSDQLNNI